MGNLPGTFAILQVLFQPRLVIPQLRVKDIRSIDFPALRQAGYKAVVFDKDNCLTLPHKDQLVPELRDAWEECKTVFGVNNVLIVSNSTGTDEDPGMIRAESVQYHLGVPVLHHSTKKPGIRCIRSIQQYFGSKESLSALHPIIVVGDRIMTDIVMANRMGALGIWTEHIWMREATAMRFLEHTLLRIALRITLGRVVEEKYKFVRLAQVTPDKSAGIFCWIAKRCRWRSVA